MRGNARGAEAWQQTGAHFTLKKNRAKTRFFF